MDNLLDIKKYEAEKNAIQKLKDNHHQDRWITDQIRSEKKRLRKRNKRSVKNKIKQIVKKEDFDLLHN